jgi:hypothetical protein
MQLSQHDSVSAIAIGQSGRWFHQHGAGQRGRNQPIGFPFPSRHRELGSITGERCRRFALDQGTCFLCQDRSTAEQKSKYRFPAHMSASS